MLFLDTLDPEINPSLDCLSFIIILDKGIVKIPYLSRLVSLTQSLIMTIIENCLLCYRLSSLHGSANSSKYGVHSLPVILPAGKNGIDLVVWQNGKEMHEKIMITIEVGEQ